MKTILLRLLPRPFVADAILSAEAESAFQRDLGIECRDAMRRHSPFFMMIYISFLLIDAVLMPDMSLYNLISRVLVIAPLVFAAIYSFSGVPGNRYDRGLMCGVAVMVCGQFMLGSAMSSAPYASCYAFLAAITPITAFAGARLTSGYYLQFAVACCLVVTGIVLFSDFPQQVKIVTPLFIVSVSAIGYIGAASLEATKRQMYAHQLQETALRRVAEDAASHDALTGLLNRRALEDRMQLIVKTGRDRGRPICVLMIDIDHFKKYNDTFGHLAGDACLRQVAGALQAQVRQGEFCARFGGEEFIVVCDGCTLTEGRLIGERLVAGVRALALPHVAPVPGSVVTISVGLYCVNMTDESLDRLVAEADAALYQAKRLGRNRLWFDGSGEVATPAPV